MDLRKTAFIISSIFSLISGISAHTGEEPAGFMGYCSEGVCHTFVDWLGHGVFGLGWLGFFIGFAVWLSLAFGIIHQARKTLAEDNKE